MESINALNKNGNTLLMEAAASGDLNEVNNLLNLGANPHITDDSGMTARSRAKNLGHDEVLAILDKAMESSPQVRVEESVNISSEVSNDKTEVSGNNPEVSQKAKNMAQARVDLESMKENKDMIGVLSVFIWLLHIVALVGGQLSYVPSSYSTSVNLEWVFNPILTVSVLFSFSICLILLSIAKSVSMTAKYVIYTSQSK
tara:strand:+ start:10557 stop:11156 length:600 start_codon:yes stop_codon:yes gene_type:complete